MKKPLLAGLVSAALVAGLMPASLAAVPSQEEAGQVLSALDIMVGDQNGDLNLGATVTRAEFTKMVIAASPYRDSAGEAASVSPYPDVPRTHWAAPYVQAAASAGYVSGYLDGTFHPAANITLAEGVTMVLPLLGYTSEDFTGAYPAGQMSAYHNLGLDEGVSATQDSPLTREDALYLFYNLMTAKTKQGTYYLNTLEPGLNLVDQSGTLDRVALVNSAMEGPVVAEGSWTSKLPFALSSIAVYRDGKPASSQAVQPLDVVYWSDSMHQLWAYSKKVTGTLERISPSASRPTSVTVAGTEYALESSDAVYSVSDLGQFRTGDAVTLLLGRGGGVAAIRPSGVSGEHSDVVGMVTAVQNSSYTDENGDSYTSYSVTLVTTSGSTATYPTQDKYLSEGDLVRVTGSGDSIQVKRLSNASLSGSFNSDATKLGRYALADDVEILDTYGDTAAIRVYPNRLSGVTLKDDAVRFYSTNEQGEIDRLILEEVTGDMHTYGVLTSAKEINSGMTLMGNYTLDVAGTAIPIVSTNTVYGVHKGACQVIGSTKDPDRIRNLSEVALDSVSSTTAISSSNQKYPVSEQVAVYEIRNDSYYYSSLSRVNGGDYILTGYYDKPAVEGGQIRVILAKAK